MYDRRDAQPARLLLSILHQFSFLRNLEKWLLEVRDAIAPSAPYRLHLCIRS